MVQICVLGLSLFEYSFSLLTNVSKSSCFSLRRSRLRRWSSGLYLCGLGQCPCPWRRIEGAKNPYKEQLLFRRCDIVDQSRTSDAHDAPPFLHVSESIHKDGTSSASSLRRDHLDPSDSSHNGWWRMSASTLTLAFRRTMERLHSSAGQISKRPFGSISKCSRWRVCSRQRVI